MDDPVTPSADKGTDDEERDSDARPKENVVSEPNRAWTNACSDSNISTAIDKFSNRCSKKARSDSN